MIFLLVVLVAVSVDPGVGTFAAVGGGFDAPAAEGGRAPVAVATAAAAVMGGGFVAPAAEGGRAPVADATAAARARLSGTKIPPSSFATAAAPARPFGAKIPPPGSAPADAGRAIEEDEDAWEGVDDETAPAAPDTGPAAAKSALSREDPTAAVAALGAAVAAPSPPTRGTR